MNLVEALVYGIVEGLTEFLPISSTGHLIITEQFLGTSDPQFQSSFKIAIQLGAILAVVALYWRALFVEWRVIQRVLIAFVPTAVLGVLLYPQVKRLLDAEAIHVVLWSLGLGGVGLILFEWLHGEKLAARAGVGNISLVQAFLIGVFQSVAFIPGVSRAAATVVGGLALGIKRQTIVEFSFLLAVPTMTAATGYDLLKSADRFSVDQVQFLLVGLVTSFVVAIIAIRYLLAFVTTHSFIAFGVYRIVAALVLALILLR